MKNSFTFAISILLLCSMLLACNFKFGDATSDDSKTEVNRKEASENDDDAKVKSRWKDKKDTSGEQETPSQSDDELPRKLGSFKYNRLDHSMYLIPKDLSADELLEIAQSLHEQEPKTIILLVDDDEQAEQFITFHRQLEDFQRKPGAERVKVQYPNDWLNKHNVNTVNCFIEGGELNWYLVKGYYLSMDKISKLE